MAEVYDRLGRLDRREQLARRAAQPAMPRIGEEPAAVDDEGFAEVLEAVGRVVLRWPGVSVMVAQDGATGQPVFRVSERDGTVDAAIVGHRPPPPAPHVGIGRMADALGGASPAARPAPRTPAESERTDPARPSADAEVPARFGRMAQALGGASRADRPAEPDPGTRRPNLRLVPDVPAGRHSHPDEPEEAGASAPAGRVPLPAETSEAVARLAQILRENPSLAATWGRESQEG